MLQRDASINNGYDNWVFYIQKHKDDMTQFMRSFEAHTWKLDEMSLVSWRNNLQAVITAEPRQAVD